MKLKKTDRCSAKFCRDEVTIMYCGKGLCDKHWDKFSATKTPDEVKQLLEITSKDTAVIEATTSNVIVPEESNQQTEVPPTPEEIEVMKMTKLVCCQCKKQMGTNAQRNRKLLAKYGTIDKIKETYKCKECRK